MLKFNFLIKLTGCCIFIILFWLWLYGKPNHCLTGLWAEVSFAQERFEYDSQGKPDPFTPWVTAEGRLQILASQEKKVGSELDLEGIIFDKYGLSYAVVNGEVVKIGDTIDGYQILKIEEKRVIFIKEGELKEIDMEE
ncbi:MAG: hypothetical protein V1858_04555 [Candidatus Gottesmanbacteria bacterium]